MKELYKAKHDIACFFIPFSWSKKCCQRPFGMTIVSQNYKSCYDCRERKIEFKVNNYVDNS